MVLIITFSLIDTAISDYIILKANFKKLVYWKNINIVGNINIIYDRQLKIISIFLFSYRIILVKKKSESSYLSITV